MPRLPKRIPSCARAKPTRRMASSVLDSLPIQGLCLDESYSMEFQRTLEETPPGDWSSYFGGSNQIIRPEGVSEYDPQGNPRSGGGTICSHNGPRKPRETGQEGECMGPQVGLKCADSCSFPPCTPPPRLVLHLITITICHFMHSTPGNLGNHSICLFSLCKYDDLLVSQMSQYMYS